MSTEEKEKSSAKPTSRRVCAGRQNFGGGWNQLGAMKWRSIGASTHGYHVAILRQLPDEADFEPCRPIYSAAIKDPTDLVAVFESTSPRYACRSACIGPRRCSWSCEHLPCFGDQAPRRNSCIISIPGAFNIPSPPRPWQECERASRARNRFQELGVV